MRLHARPLPPGPRVGHTVVLRNDVLAEIARESRAAPASWCFLPGGTKARLLGWRDGDREEPRAVIDVSSAMTPGERRLVAFVGERHVVMGSLTTGS